MLLIDEQAALAAIPAMLPPDQETRRKAFDLIEEVLSARGEFSAEDKKRLGSIAQLFGVEAASAPPNLTVVPMPTQARA
jgi:hypothetical protein